MIKSLHTRILLVNFAIVFSALLILGLMVATVFRNQYVKEREQQMQRECAEINRIVEAKYFFKENQIAAREELQEIARKNDALIWIENRNGNFSSFQDAQKTGQWDGFKENAVDYAGYVQESMAGYAWMTYTFFNGNVNEPIMTVGRPLEINYNIEGAIFMHTRLDSMQDQINQIYTNVFLASLCALIICAVLVPVASRRFTKPLVEANSIVKSFAKGDFADRLKISSHDEMGELAKNINSMADDLQALEDLRRSFVANVSHELRSPLTSIKGFIEASYDCSQEEREEYLTIALDETRRMNLLVNDLLDLAKIESGAIPLQQTRFDINEQMRRILIAFEGKIDEKKIDVNVLFEQEACWVFADADRISQVVRNLIDNAIKFTPEGGLIGLSTKQHKETAFIEISDTGMGIPEQDITHIWERFYKVDRAHTRGREGTGLGLSIVQKIIEQHGTSIEALSEAGKGTTFKFSLPIAKKNQR